MRDYKVKWPVLSMRSWFSFLLEHHPALVLGGHALHGDWRQMFLQFWEEWRLEEPSHDVYSSGKPLQFCLPYFTHGDEGQTTRKTPFMVESFQAAISWKGIGCTTMSGPLGLMSYASNLCPLNLKLSCIAQGQLLQPPLVHVH